MPTPGVDYFPMPDPVDPTSNVTEPGTTPPFTPPPVDTLDLTMVQYIFYDPTTGLIKGSCQGHKYHCDEMATTMNALGWTTIVGTYGTVKTHTVNISGSTPVVEELATFLANNSWNKTSAIESGSDGVVGDPDTWDTLGITADGNDYAQLGSNLPASIDVFIRFPQSSGMLPATYTFDTTQDGGVWSFDTTTPGDYFFTFSADGYQDYNVHITAT